jgi:hypothetical protein
MSKDTLIAQMERDIAEQTARLDALRGPLTVRTINGLSPREFAQLDRAEVRSALAAGPPPLPDMHGPGGVTAAHLNAMSAPEALAFRKANPEAHRALLAGRGPYVTDEALGRMTAAELDAWRCSK